MSKVFSSFNANASHLMAVSDIIKLRGNFTAFGNSLVTAWMERASGRGGQGAGDFPFEKDVFSIFFDERICDRYSR